MTHLSLGNLRRINFPIFFGAMVALSNLIHLPSRLWVGAFDRNAAPQFVAIVLTALISLGYLIGKKSIALNYYLSFSLLALILASAISLLLSDNFYTGLIGDTGRFAGIASMWSLLICAVTASTFTPKEFFSAIKGIAIGVSLVAILGALQSINLINLPTGGGVGSTYGNLDFLAAAIGTTLILVYIALQGSRGAWPVFLSYLALCMYILWKIDAKQGWLDLLLIALSLGLYQLYRFLNFPELSALAWKAISTFFLLLWSEAIFLIPMTKIHIAGISNDPNVSIRSDFWFSATQMFRHHLGFGVRTRQLWELLRKVSLTWFREEHRICSC
jgi:hypothetical protein